MQDGLSLPSTHATQLNPNEQIRTPNEERSHTKRTAGGLPKMSIALRERKGEHADEKKLAIPTNSDISHFSFSSVRWL